MRNALVLAVATTWLGCASAPPKNDSEGHLLDEKQELATPAQAPAPAPASAAPSTLGAPGVISRPELMRVLDGAPGLFLQHVDSEARFSQGRFVGWKLVAFYPGDPRFAGVDLRAGDVVKRVNGQSIERPEQLMDVWQQLRTANELTVDIERDGQPRTLRWTIAP